MKVGIIGCRGRMGTMLTTHLQEAGHEVQGADLPLDAPDIAAACAGAETVFLCVPAGALEEVCSKVVPHLPPSCILADVTSVKVEALRIMARRWQGAVAGTHPLFGPESQRGQVAVTPLYEEDGSLSPRNEAAASAVEQLFLSLGWPTFRCTAEEHDRAVAAVQGMNYVSTVAYFALLAGIPHIAPFLTPSFRRRKDAALTMLTEDAELFSQLFKANPASREAVAEFQTLLDRISADPAAFVRQAQRGLALSPSDERQDAGKS